MADNDLRLAFDDEIDSAILGVIRGAKEYLYIVTPFITMWGHVKDELLLAKQKGVRV